MLTHYNLVSMLCQLHASEALAENDTIVCVVPMYHLYGLHVVVNLGLSQGATVVILPRYELRTISTNTRALRSNGGAARSTSRFRIVSSSRGGPT